MNRQAPRVCLLAASLMLAALLAHADANSPAFKPGHPAEYTLRAGDSLWNVSAQFLEQPWELAQAFAAPAPDVIGAPLYPGDTLKVTHTKQLKVVRLKPEAREIPKPRPIPTIAPQAIEAFLIAPVLVSPREFNRAGRVVAGVNRQRLLAPRDEFYATGIDPRAAQKFALFKHGRKLRDPISGELFGYEAVHLGEAQLLRAAANNKDLSKLRITRARQDIRPGHRLLPITDAPPLPYYYPRAYPGGAHGWVMHVVDGDYDAVARSVVLVSLGARDGVSPGHVFQAQTWHQATDVISGRDYQSPYETSGHLMAFRVFKKFSYALVMRTGNIGVRVDDRVTAP